MSFSRRGLALLAAAWLPLAAAAVPAPISARTSQGPITDALRLRSLLPATAPPLVLPAAMVGEGVIGLEHHPAVFMEIKRIVTRMVPVARQVTENVQLPGGKVVRRTRVVTQMVPVMQEVSERIQRPGRQAAAWHLPVKSCKFFVVSKDGKLEALDTAKATALLKKRTVLLAGGSVNVDPRHLTLVKPGTLYLVFPPPPPPPPPGSPLEKKPRT